MAEVSCVGRDFPAATGGISADIPIDERICVARASLYRAALTGRLYRASLSPVAASAYRLAKGFAPALCEGRGEQPRAAMQRGAEAESEAGEKGVSDYSRRIKLNK